MLSPFGMQTNKRTMEGGWRSRRSLWLALWLTAAMMGVVPAQEAGSSGQATNPPSAVTVTSPAPELTTNAAAFGQPINQAGTFGVGPMIGEPIGLGAKLWLSGKTALDAGAGWSFADPDGFQLHGDFLFHKFDLFHLREGQLPLYFGVGGRVKFVDHGDNRAGLRGPVGISYLLPTSRLELYAEVVPILDLAPSTRLQWNGGVGVRWYFH